MDSPNAKANTMTGTQASIAPNAVNPSTEDRCPSWKIQTSAPNTAPSERMFITRALTGMSTEPVRQRAEALAREGVSCSYALDDRPGVARLLETLALMAAEQAAT